MGYCFTWMFICEHPYSSGRVVGWGCWALNRSVFVTFGTRALRRASLPVPVGVWLWSLPAAALVCVGWLNSKVTRKYGHSSERINRGPVVPRQKLGKLMLPRTSRIQTLCFFGESGLILEARRTAPHKLSLVPPATRPRLPTRTTRRSKLRRRNLQARA